MNEKCEEIPCGSLENLNIRDDAGTNKPAPNSQAPSNKKPSHLILCDAWYGFPTQKRPRRERICAVSRQLENFLQWRLDAKLDASECQVHLLGSTSDVEAVEDRITEIGVEGQPTETFCGKVVFKPNVGIHEAIQHWRNESGTNEEDVVYLSPDASDKLSPICRPPSMVVIGMLIDRRITSDRSRKRAEASLQLRALKLPLDELNVKELDCNEPLNVDTVMELMQRWWANCDKLDKQSADSALNQQKYRQCFVQAAAWAMKSHRERHPNRIVHKK